MALQQAWLQVVGPPGTGKTATGVHILGALFSALRLQKGLQDPSVLLQTDEEGGGLCVGNVFPRICVVAPSNQAVDELMVRAAAVGGLAGLSGSSCTPFMLRVGNQDNMAEVIRDTKTVNVHSLVDDIIRIRWDARGKEVTRWKALRETRRDQCAANMTRLFSDLLTTLDIPSGEKPKPSPDPLKQKLTAEEKASAAGGNTKRRGGGRAARRWRRQQNKKKTKEGLEREREEKEKAVAREAVASETEEKESAAVEVPSAPKAEGDETSRLALASTVLSEYRRWECQKLAMSKLEGFRYPNQAKRDLIRDFVSYAEIVLTTANGLGGVTGYSQCSLPPFDAVLIDESCQMKEAESLIPLLGAQRVVWLGDPNQLRPTVMYHGRHRAPLVRTLFERVHDQVPSHMLNIQYRMHPEISVFPSKTFYDGKLTDGPNTLSALYTKPYHAKLPPYQFLHVEGVEERRGTSFVNLKEVEVIISLLKTMLDSGCNLGPVGIITPYMAQKQLLEQRIQSSGIAGKMDGMASGKAVDWTDASGILVDTVDAFQGAERDIIFLTCVRTGGDIGFLTDRNRLNVSLTRAKFACCVVGHATALQAHPLWGELVADATTRQLLTPA